MGALGCEMAVPSEKFEVLTTVFQQVKCEELEMLKQKQEEMSLALERARMEREDFRMGNGPSFCIDFSISSRQLTKQLMSFTQSRVDIIAEACNALDMGQNETARAILSAALAEAEQD